MSRLMPDFDNMTLNDIKQWARSVGVKNYQLGEIEATLKVNCKRGSFGDYVYDDSKSVTTNLVNILIILINKDKTKV